MLQLSKIPTVLQKHVLFPPPEPCSQSSLSLGYPFLLGLSGKILFIFKNQLKQYLLSVSGLSPPSLLYSTASFVPSAMSPEVIPYAGAVCWTLRLGVVSASALGKGLDPV